MAAGWSPAELARATADEGQAEAKIDFIAEAQCCPRCGKEVRLHKTQRRRVVTLAHGAFGAREVIQQCVADGCAQIVRSQALRRIVRPRQRFGYDLIVHVGLLRYLQGMQREEIREQLRRVHGIELSAATVSGLCDRFLVALESLHLLRAPYLRAAMQGGYPLHLDATCDRGKGGLFVCLDGWRGWVLKATRIDSEREAQLRPLVDETVGLFGVPLATVRDLGEGGAGAVAHLHERGVVDLVCHFHFLAAVGKNLVDGPYGALRRLIRGSRVRTDLRSLLRELRRYEESQGYHGRFGSGRVRQELLALLLWLLDGTGDKDAAYPFALPHLAFVRRCQQVIEQADQWVPCPRSEPERRALGLLQRRVGRIEREARLAQTVVDLDRRWQAFCELRDVLRLSRGERADAQAPEQTDLPELGLRQLQEIQQTLIDYRQQLVSRTARLTRAEAKACPETIILRYLKRYGDRLFGHPALRDEQGKVLCVVDRTNNVLESLFGRAKQRLRRRLGRAHLGRDLEQQPPQAMLTANLRHPDYVRVLCGSLEHLPEAFADIDTTTTGSDVLLRQNRDFKLGRRVRALLDAPGPAGNAGQTAPSVPPSACPTVV
jgi:hypothetical protein